MKKLLFIGILGAVLMSGCSKKDNETDLTSNWVGVYIDPSSVGSTSTTSTINNIVVSKVNASTLKVQIKALETSYIYTLTTLQGAAINGTTQASIDEVDGMAEHTGQYHITGTLTLEGSHLTFSAIATNIESSTRENSPINLSFSGDKHK